MTPFISRTTALLGALGICFLLNVSANAEEPITPPKQDQKLLSALSYDYEFESFKDFDTWRNHSFELSHKFTSFSLVGRINTAKRFDRWGQQYEFDAYPGLGEGMYAYLNVGYSDAGFFPEWRVGGEFYKSLPASFEASIGFRHLRFTDDITLYTGSLSRYHGDYLSTVRTYVTNDDDGLSWSLAAQIRRYYATVDDYLSLVGSYGESPEPDATIDELDRLDSWGLRITGQKRLRESFLISGKAGYREQQFTINTNTRKSYFIGAGITKRF